MNWNEATKRGELVMRGSLVGQSPANVLLALSLSRQFTSVELLTGPDHVEGKVYLKSGCVLAVETDGNASRDILAFDRLLRRPIKGYIVYRLPCPDAFPTPIGRLSTQLMASNDVGEAIPVPNRTPNKLPYPPVRMATGTLIPVPVAAKISEPVTVKLPTQAKPAEPVKRVVEPTEPANRVVEPATPARPVTARPAPAPARPAPVRPVAARPAPVRPVAARPAPVRPAPARPVAVSATPDTARATIKMEPLAPAMALPQENVSQQGQASSAMQVIAVVSPKGGSGKTTVALNLSVALAKSGVRVVLVDADPNGDLLSALGAQAKAATGIYDVLYAGDDSASLPLRRTADSNLRLVSSIGDTTSVALLNEIPPAERWRDVLVKLGADADVVIVDTPAGMFGATASVMGAADSVLAVLQSESVPYRSFPMLKRGLKALSNPPKLLGVLLNMVSSEDNASVKIAESARADWGDQMLTTELPRHLHFHVASERGYPAAIAKESASSLGNLFAELATEVQERAALPTQPVATSFLL